MRLKNGKKGAALVSVLVATTFMTVLVTTLLYMSYMNYLTRSMRHTSTDNFYTDEFALDDLATSLQELGADDPAGLGKDYLVSCTSSDGGNTWNAGTLQSLIRVASKEADIAVGVPDGKTPTMKVNSRSVTYKNVKLTSTTRKGGYVSSLVSDITIAWPDQPLNSYGIYDFSIITDSQIEAKEGQCAVGGCLYCRQQPDKDWAIKVDSSGVLNLNCPFGVVHGKIVIEDGGCLCVGGDLYVTGGIDIQEGGVMFVTGSIEYAGMEPNSGRMKGKTDKVKKHPGTDAEVAAWVQQFDDLAGTDGFTGAMVNTKAHILKNGSTTEWYAADAPSAGYLFYNNKFGENRAKPSQTLSDGTVTYAQVLGSSLDTFNSGCFSDSLVLSNSPSLNIRGNLANSTIIEAAKDITIVLDITADPTYLGKMTEEGYEKAKDVLFDGSLDNYNGGTPQFLGGYFATYKDSTELHEFSNSGSDFSAGVIHYYRIGTKNVLPIGSLITPEAETNVATLLNYAQGGTVDPVDSFIIYNNWYKE